MKHKEMRANADKLAELCRVLEGYSREMPDSEAGQMLGRYLPRVEELSGQLSFDVKKLTAENRMLSERVRLFTEEQNRRLIPPVLPSPACGMEGSGEQSRSANQQI